eukprot:15445689-Alexandrium_andersonii.AAC.1
MDPPASFRPGWTVTKSRVAGARVSLRPRTPPRKRRQPLPAVEEEEGEEGEIAPKVEEDDEPPPRAPG